MNEVLLRYVPVFPDSLVLVLPFSPARIKAGLKIIESRAGDGSSRDGFHLPNQHKED
jgi:hypothetical protein